MVKHLAVVGQDLVRHPVDVHGRGQRVAHRPGGGPSHQASAHTEPGVVVDAGDGGQFGAVGQVDAPDDVHLPRLYRLPITRSLA